VTGAAVEADAVAGFAGDDPKLSCLISCSHSGPEGGCWALVGRHGAMKPAGRVRLVNTADAVRA
jgi:hypothetical protein